MYGGHGEEDEGDDSHCSRFGGGRVLPFLDEHNISVSVTYVRGPSVSECHNSRPQYTAHTHLSHDCHDRTRPYTAVPERERQRVCGERRERMVQRTQTLNRKSMTSPSCTSYSLPSDRALPCALASFSEPHSTKSSYPIVSARINPFSKSVWITPAA